MLSKKERLSRIAFSRFFSSGKRHHTDAFTLVYSPFTTFHGSVVVPKKVEKKAVGRNKIRRRIYTLLRTYARAHGVTGVCIVLVKKKIETLSFPELKVLFEETMSEVYKIR